MFFKLLDNFLKKGDPCINEYRLLNVFQFLTTTFTNYSSKQIINLLNNLRNFFKIQRYIFI